MQWKQYICFSSAVLNKMPGGLFFLFVFFFFVCFVCVCVCVHVFYIFIHIHIFVPFVNIANSNSGKKNLILPSSHQPFRKHGKILFYFFFFPLSSTCPIISTYTGQEFNFRHTSLLRLFNSKYSKNYVWVLYDHSAMGKK